MAQPKASRAGRALAMVVGALRPLVMALTRRDWHGVSNLPPDGAGVVVVSNHISHVDFLTSAHFVWDNGRPPRFLAKESLFRIPVIGRIISACRQIPVYRESRDAAKAYRAAVKAVENGECVMIYPEGTITRDTNMWPMTGRTGAARIALETGCDIIPLAQWGPQEILPPYSKKIRLFPRKMMRLTAGPPVDLDDLRDEPVTRELLNVATDRIMDALTAELAELRHEVAPAQRFDPRAAGIPSTGNPQRPARNDDDEAGDSGEADA